MFNSIFLTTFATIFCGLRKHSDAMMFSHDGSLPNTFEYDVPKEKTKFVRKRVVPLPSQVTNIRSLEIYDIDSFWYVKFAERYFKDLN